MTEEIIIDVNGCPHKSDDDCMKVPICNEYGDLMGYQSCEAQTLCPYRSQKKIERLEQENKDLKKQIESDKGLITVGGKQQYQYLQRVEELEQENKELKSDVLKWQKAFSRQYQINENKGYSKAEENYRSALEEIKNDLKEVCKEECDYTKPKFCGDCDCRYGQILTKINEVLNFWHRFPYI